MVEEWVAVIAKDTSPDIKTSASRTGCDDKGHACTEQSYPWQQQSTLNTCDKGEKASISRALNTRDLAHSALILIGEQVMYESRWQSKKGKVKAIFASSG